MKGIVNSAGAATVACGFQRRAGEDLRDDDNLLGDDDALERASAPQLRAEIERLRAELAMAHSRLAEERRRFLLSQSSPAGAAVVYDLSDKARQDLAREIWRERQKWTLGYKLAEWWRRRLRA